MSDIQSEGAIYIADGLETNMVIHIFDNHLFLIKHFFLF